MRSWGDRVSSSVVPGAWLRVAVACISLAIALPASSLAQDDGLPLFPPLGEEDWSDQGVGGERPGERADGEAGDERLAPGVVGTEGGVPVGSEEGRSQVGGEEPRAAEAAGKAPEEAGISASVPDGLEGVEESGSSSLLGYLGERQEALPEVPAVAEPGLAGAAAALFGCPRSVLEELLKAATAKADVVSSLEIEREVLTLCAERQELVVTILQAEAELGRLWRESTAPAEEEVRAAPENVLAQLTEFEGALVVEFVEEPVEAEPEPEPEPEPVAYGWFSIFGTGGDLQARVSDGTEVWFVREGDELPGGVVVDWISVSPPGVHVLREGEDVMLPYRSAQGGDG